MARQPHTTEKTAQILSLGTKATAWLGTSFMLQSQTARDREEGWLPNCQPAPQQQTNPSIFQTIPGPPATQF